MTGIDDTGLYHYPLFNLDVKTCRAKIELDLGKDDAKTFILRRIGIYKHPFIDAALTLKIDADYFNIESSGYEPLIEPWKLDCNYKKVLPNSFDQEGVFHISKL
jgi:hypothetical protein